MSRGRMRDARTGFMVVAGSIAVFFALVPGPAIAQQVANAPAPGAAEDGTTSSDTGLPPRIWPAPPRPVYRPRPVPRPRPRPAPIEVRPQRPGAPAPGAVDGGTTSGPARPRRIRRAPAQPVDEYAGGGAAQASASRQSAPDATASSEAAVQAPGSGSGAPDDRGETQGDAEPSPEVSDADGASGAQTEGSPASKHSDDTSPNMIQRIVGVVPLPLKIALAILVVLLVLAIAGAWRTQRRLALAERRAATDVLTGLPNRRHADETLERLLASARRKGRSVAVMLFDLDHFKAINDRFGHALGDDALRATADGTRELLRGSDYVARFGGEEFIVLLSETGSAEARTVAEALRSRIAELGVAGLDGRMTASFGVAVYPDNGVGADELIKAADVALYRAKETGRNRVETSAERLLRVA
jgi:diguanylate cyclase (GGDEF)-like protein